MKKHVFVDNDTSIKNIYNQTLNEFRTFYTNNKDTIDNNLEKIRFTIYGSIEDEDFDNTLNEALELEPVS